MIKTTYIGLFILAISITGALTSFFIIGSLKLTAVFSGWILVGAIIIALFSRTFSEALNPLLTLKTYEDFIKCILEEFSVHDIKPLFIPSNKAGEPIMLITPTEKNSNFNLKIIPKRFIIYNSNNYALRIETLGTFLYRQLEGITLDGIPTLESTLKTLLINDLNIAKDILLIESPEENKVIIKITSPLIRDVLRNESNSNVYLQIVGVLLAESLKKVVQLDNLKIDGKNLILNFKVLD